MLFLISLHVKLVHDNNWLLGYDFAALYCFYVIIWVLF